MTQEELQALAKNSLDKMVEQYEEKKGYSPAVETVIPTTSEELVEILKSYKIDDKKESEYNIRFDNSDVTVPISSFIKTNEDHKDKKDSFFNKVRSIFKK